MAHELRIQRKRSRGWKMPEDAVYVGRPSDWGNPFGAAEVDGKFYVICCDGNWFFETPNLDAAKRSAVRLFEAYLANDGSMPGQIRDAGGAFIAIRAKEELRGKKLACWCSLDQPCHADVLAELANK
jgi:hypothetical protein